MLLNLKDVEMEETTYSLLPEGTYDVKVTSCEEKTSSKGNVFWNLTYETSNGDKIYDNIYFTEKTLNRVKKLFHTLGLDVDSENDYQPEDLIGCYMKAAITVETYTDKSGNDKQKNVIDLWNCEPLTLKKTKKSVKKEVEEDDSDEIPF